LKSSMCGLVRPFGLRDISVLILRTGWC